MRANGERRDLFGRERARREFDAFVAQQAQGLLRTAYLLASDRAEAEDLVQECLLRVARRWPRVRRMDHPGAYARRVLVNVSLDRARAGARRRDELAAPASEAASQRADDGAARDLYAVDARSDLMALLATLPARARAMLVLRYFEDLSEAQVAAVLRCSVGTVKSTTSRALAELRRRHGGEPAAGAPSQPGPPLQTTHTPQPSPRAATALPPRIQGVQTDA